MKSVLLIGLSSENHPNELNKDPNNVQYASNASWAAISHYPALQQLKNKYILSGLLNSSEERGKKIANILEHSDPNLKIYRSEEEVIQDYKNIDIAVVSVNVRYHFKTIMNLIESPMLIYCEWPLAKSLNESETILSSRKNHAKSTIVGLQSRKAPQILMAKRLIESGALGRVLRTRASGYCGTIFSGQILEGNEDFYLNPENGHTLFSIPFAHLFDAIMYTLGSYPKKLFAEVINRNPEYVVVNKEGVPTGKVKKNESPNDVLIAGTFENNVTVSVNAIPGGPIFEELPGLRWEIFGTEGYILIESQSCFVELDKLTLKYFDQNGNMTSSDMKDYNPFAQNVAQMYEAIEPNQEVQRFAVSGVPTFKDAVVLHRILDKIMLSSTEGEVVNFTEDDFYKF
ncbi:unnamed protein product [Debaryomyces tyrocola]|nr:unnamed protein product [Debaryomyces tyrocola]